MSEIKTEVKRNADGSYTITDAHSTADILRWLLTQDDKDTILYLLGVVQPKREWVGLTDEDIDDVLNTMSFARPKEFARVIDYRLKEKNSGL